MTPQEKIRNIYQVLLKTYGLQGWWPIVASADGQGQSRNANGYHPGIYDIPKNDLQKLEIATGAILTQNTNWNNVVSALNSLTASGLFSMQGLQHGKIEEIALAIKSAGYYNQKAKSIKNLVDFLQRFPFKNLEQASDGSVRKKLLEITGIGPETADCIMLYALKKPSFVIDAYTRRIFSALGLVSESISYNTLQTLFESSLEKDLVVFQEYHALLVQHGKCYYRKKPYGHGDTILHFN